MSAAATFPWPVDRPGWPPPGPKNGFCPATHPFNERIWRVTEPGKVQVGCIHLILDQTSGYRREWATLAVGWFRWLLDLESDKAVQDALKDATQWGLIEQKPANGRLKQYRVNLEAIYTAPDYKARPRLVEDAEEAEHPEAPEAPEIRYVPEQSGVSYCGKPLKQYHSGTLMIAERGGATTVALCGECQTVGIFEMIAAQELSLPGGEEKAKQNEPQFREGELRPTKHTPPHDPTPPPEIPDPVRVQDLFDGLTERFHQVFGAGPQNHYTVGIAEALGPDVPIPEFLNFCVRQKTWYITRKAKKWGIFKGYATEFRNLWQAAKRHQEGVLCGCRAATRLRPGDQCAQCGATCPAPPEEAAPKPEQPPDDGDWGPVKVELLELLPPMQYDNWVGRTSIDSVSGDVLRVLVPTPQTRTRLEEDDYGALVGAALKAAHGDRYSRVEYVVQKE